MAAKAWAKEISIDTLLDMKDNLGKDYKKIKRIEDELLELKEIIGNVELKRKIAEQIIMLIQNLHDTEMLNIALFGPPGTGKTYNTKSLAVEIIDGSIPNDREGLTKRYFELKLYFILHYFEYMYICTSCIVVTHN